MFKNYINSFRKLKELQYPFIIDFIITFMIYFLWTLFGALLTNRAKVLSGGKGIDQLKIGLLSNPDVAQAFSKDVKIFTAVLIAGTIIVVLLTLLSFSFSRMLIWGRSNFKKWNLLNLALIVVFCLVMAVYFVIRFFLNSLSFSSQLTSSIVINVANGIFLILFLMLTFLSYKSFSKKHKVMEALSDAFDKLQNLNFWKVLLFVLSTGVILTMFFSVLRKKFYWQVLAFPRWLTLLLEVTVSLIYIVWMRRYITKNA